ncbi:MAG: flagellar basal body rod protein FlgB [Pseudomonadota bacterium]|jgi:flagellar basal-body rod protein FlgB
MISALEGSTPVVLSLALDAAVLRQQAIAQNIANANSPAYRKQSVSFEENMAAQRSALAHGGKLNLSAPALASYAPQLLQAPTVGGVALDEEVAKLSSTVLQHQVLLRALNKHFGLLSMAISEGKR